MKQIFAFLMLLITSTSLISFEFVPRDVPFHESMGQRFSQYYSKHNCSHHRKDKNLWYYRNEIAITPKEFYEFAINLYEKNGIHKAISTQEVKIPKIIHRIWLGSQQPERYKNFGETWKKFHPDWEYKLWTDKDIETLGNFPYKDIFLKESNWGAKADILRYVILEKFGGLYVDTDFECLKPLDFLHHTYNFYSCSDPCIPFRVANGLIGASAHHPILKACLENIGKFYKKHRRNSVILSTGPGILTKSIWTCAGLENNVDILFPSTYFYPVLDFFVYDYKIIYNKDVKNPRVHPESFAIHYWDGSW